MSASVPTVEGIMAILDRTAKNAEENERKRELERKLEREEYERKQAEYEKKRKLEQEEYEKKRKLEREEDDQRRRKDMREFDKKLDKITKRFDKKTTDLEHDIGKIAEGLIENGLVRRFGELGIELVMSSRERKFFYPWNIHEILGEVDFFLESLGEVILVEVKATLSTSDVQHHFLRLERYKKCAEAWGDRRVIMGAVHGLNIANERAKKQVVDGVETLVKPNAKRLALSSGLYVIEHSGDTVRILLPQGGEVKRW